MTRYPNPLAAVVGLIDKAFATLDDGNGGRPRSLVTVPSRPKARRSSSPSAPQGKETSTADGGEQRAGAAKRAS